ncbi:S66 peptidase family protein [Citrifermentans bremense]|uniref:S66 peptidase family protein n=1 Tax=Citrifermentans bremense TaxID=60035 RepID=UPI00040BACC9|nr:LD-carboxypeptidase [Citrifermentans bremense]
MDNVYIISPSYLIKKKREFTAGIKQLSKLGFNVLNPHFQTVLPSPQEKAEQIHRACADSGADMILALRGGYSAMKSLPFIDFDHLKNHPKIIAGFSDLTALLNPIHERTGMVTLHAPMVASLKDPTAFTVGSFMNAVRGYPEKNLFQGAPVKVYRHGTAAGILKGGNLVTLTALINTEWEMETENSILFLEEIDEKLHKVDRALTQWILAGKLKGVRGIILGDFGGLKSREVYQILASQMELNFPVVHCPNIGHVPDKITLPVGAEVELNTQKKQLVIRKLALPGGRS